MLIVEFFVDFHWWCLGILESIATDK
jgi:hypothetical protein